MVQGIIFLELIVQSEYVSKNSEIKCKTMWKIKKATSLKSFFDYTIFFYAKIAEKRVEK